MQDTLIDNSKAQDSRELTLTTPARLDYYLDGRVVVSHNSTLGELGITDLSNIDSVVEDLDEISETWRLETSDLYWSFGDDCKIVSPSTPIELILYVTDTAIVKKQCIVSDLVYMQEIALSLYDFEHKYDDGLYEKLWEFRNEHAERGWHVDGLDY